MTFQFPKITYPLQIDTIGKMLALGYELSVCCRNTRCNRMDRVNLVGLAKRLGMDHSSAHEDLKPIFSCTSCKAAGRSCKNVGFIVHTVTGQHTELPADRYPWAA